MLVGAACLAGCETSQPDNDGQDTEATPGSDEENQDEEIPDDNPDGDETPDDGEKPDDNPDEDLPELEVTDDVCTKMKDLEFMRYCYENFDVNGDKKVAMYEANAVKSINISDEGIADLSGIEYFTNLESLSASNVENLDLSYNTLLSSLELTNCSIDELDLHYYTDLSSISLSNCPLKTLDFQYNPNLSTIHIENCPIEELDLTQNALLSAFSFNLNSLKSVIFPTMTPKMNTIKENAFSECQVLTNISLPDNITYIGYSAFKGLTKLNSITLPENLKKIGDNAFDNTGLTSVILPDGIERIGWAAFANCSNLTDIQLPESIDFIDGFAFSGCALRSVVLPPNIEEIGKWTFNGCSNLVELDASSCYNVKSIGEEAFSDAPIEKFLLATSEPPILDTKTFTSYYGDITVASNAVLAVPAESVEAYKNSDWAEYFPNIVALEQ